MNRRPLLSKTQNICLVILCVLFILLAIIMVRELLNKRKDKEPDYNVVDISSESVTKAMNVWQLGLCDDMDSFVKNIYNGVFYTKDMNSIEKLYIVLKQDPRKEKFTLEEINNSFSSLAVGNTLEDSDIMDIVNKNLLKSSYFLKYNNGLLNANSLSSTICNSDEQILTNVNKAYENGIYLNVYVNMAYSKKVTNDEGNIVYDYYKDVDGKNLVERLSKNDNPNWEEYNLYKYSFLIQDNNYKLESVILEK